MAKLVDIAGWPRLRAPVEGHFAALVRAVAFQQLAGPAAAAIHRRVVAALGGEVTPGRVLAAPETALRATGLSAAKLASIRDLAARALDGSVVLAPRRLARLSDQAIVEALSKVRGIGRWTAEMFLIFQLRRPDVWPIGDLGVRRGYSVAYGVPMPSARELEPLGDPFRPLRSTASWYLWRAAEMWGGVAPVGIET